MWRKRQRENMTLEEIAEIQTQVRNGHPEYRRSQAEENYQKVLGFIAIRKRKRTARQFEWQNRSGSHTGRVPDSEPLHSLNAQKDSRFYRNQAYALFPIEMVIGALLSEWVPEDYGDWKYVLGAASGLAIMLGVRALPKNLFKFATPLLSEEDQKKAASVLTALFMAAAAILLFNRFNGSEFSRDTLGGLALIAIGLVLPLLSAIYFQLSDHYRELNDLTDEFDRLDYEIGVAESLLREMDVLRAGGTLPEVEPAPEPEPEPDEALVSVPVEERTGVATRRASSFLPFLVTAALMVGMTGCGVKPAKADPPHTCQAIRVTEDWDTSGSVDALALEGIRREVQVQVLRHPCVLSVGVRGFATAREVLATPFIERTIPQRATFDERECGKKKFTYNMYDESKKSYDKACQGKKDAFARQEAQKRQGLVEGLAREVGKLDFKKESPESCIYKSVSRALAEPASVKPIIITDLNEECSSSPGAIKPLFGAKGGARPVVIVVPSNGDKDPIGTMEKRMQELRERAPIVTIIPYNQVKTLGDVLQAKKQ